MGMMEILYGSTLKKGFSDQFHGREIVDKKSGLQDKNVDDIVGRIIKQQQESE